MHETAGSDLGPRVAETLEAIGAVFDHVAHAVPSIREVLPLYTDLLGGKVVMAGINSWARHLAVVVEWVGGRIELIEPLPGFSPSSTNFLERNPRGGLHHITFKVPELFAAVAAVEAHGFTPILTNVASARWKETFLHPRETHGVLLQLAESHLPPHSLESPLEELFRRAAAMAPT